MISLYDSSRRRSEANAERSGTADSLLSWRTSSSIRGAEARREMREASARRFWRRESLLRSGVFPFGGREREREGGREGERERERKGGRDERGSKEFFFFGIEHSRRRSETKRQLKRTGERQEPVVELLEAVGGEVDGLRERKKNEREEKRERRER